MDIIFSLSFFGIITVTASDADFTQHNLFIETHSRDPVHLQHQEMHVFRQRVTFHKPKVTDEQIYARACTKESASNYIHTFSKALSVIKKNENSLTWNYWKEGSKWDSRIQRWTTYDNRLLIEYGDVIALVEAKDISHVTDALLNLAKNLANGKDDKGKNVEFESVAHDETVPPVIPVTVEHNLPALTEDQMHLNIGLPQSLSVEPEGTPEYAASPIGSGTENEIRGDVENPFVLFNDFKNNNQVRNSTGAASIDISVGPSSNTTSGILTPARQPEDEEGSEGSPHRSNMSDIPLYPMFNSLALHEGSHNVPNQEQRNLNDVPASDQEETCPITTERRESQDSNLRHPGEDSLAPTENSQLLDRRQSNILPLQPDQTVQPAGQTQLLEDADARLERETKEEQERAQERAEVLKREVAQKQAEAEIKIKRAQEEQRRKAKVSADQQKINQTAFSGGNLKKDINLSGQNIGKEAVTEFLRNSVQRVNDTTKLNLSNLRLTNHVLAPLLSTLQNKNNLTELDLSGNNFTNQEIILFLRSLNQIQVLTKLKGLKIGNIDLAPKKFHVRRVITVQDINAEIEKLQRYW